MSAIEIIRLLTAFFTQLLQPAQVAMIGDSIIANLATTKTQSLLHAPYNKALNLGVHGNTSAQIATRINSIPKSVKTLVLEGGGNDVLAALGSNSMNASIVDMIAHNYEYMLNQIPRTTHVLLLGIAHVDETIVGLVPNSWFSSVNARLSILAGRFPNITVLTDAQNVSMVGLTIDGVHPSTAGYVQLFSKIP